MKAGIRRCLSGLKKYWVVIALALVLGAVFFVRFYTTGGTFSVAWGNPKDSLVVTEMTTFFKRSVPLFKDPGYAGKYEKIGLLTDIHADRYKRRSVDSGTIYPRQYDEYLPKVFDKMRERGIDTVIATGDNVNSGKDDYARSLAKIAEEKHMHVIWVMGNHDSDKSMAALGVVGSKDYFFDYGGTRIIALDDARVTRATGNYEGGIDQEQLDWLRGVLKTEKKVIIAMHIPIFREQIPWMYAVQAKAEQNVSEGHVTPFFLPSDTVVASQYDELEKIFRESGNVKLVVTGHWHLPWQKVYGGIQYYGEVALTHEKFKGSYGIIDLNSDAVEYSTTK